MSHPPSSAPDKFVYDPSDLRPAELEKQDITKYIPDERYALNLFGNGNLRQREADRMDDDGCTPRTSVQLSGDALRERAIVNRCVRANWSVLGRSRDMTSTALRGFRGGSRRAAACVWY